MRLDRLLSIVITLLNRDRVTAAELARRFGVTVRTVYRDLEAIQAAGIPVASASGNTGGYGILPNYRLERQVLTLSDMGAMLTALRGIRTSLPAREIDQAIEKVGSLVPRERKAELEAMGEQVALDMTGWAFDEHRRDILRRLHEAIRTTRLAAFTYRNLRGQTERRVVEPMTLLYKGSSWYLFGWCRLKSDYRLFHTRRISGLEVQLRTFRRRAASYRDYLAPAEEPANTVDLVLRFPQAHRLKVEELFPSEAITTVGRHLVVRVRYPEDEWVHSLILGLGDRVEVLEPAALRETIRSTIGRMARVYGQPPPNLT